MTEVFFSDFQLGIHSEIPKCCVHFYCEMLHAGGQLLLARVNEARRRSLPGKRVTAGYVPCSECWARIADGSLAPTQIHTCRDSTVDAMCAYTIARRRAGIEAHKSRR